MQECGHDEDDEKEREQTKKQTLGRGPLKSRTSYRAKCENFVVIACGVTDALN